MDPVACEKRTEEREEVNSVSHVSFPILVFFFYLVILSLLEPFWSAFRFSESSGAVLKLLFGSVF